MTQLKSTTAMALALGLLLSPAAAMAGKGGVPADQALANSQAAAHAHSKKADPNPGKGADSVEEEDAYDPYEDPDLSDIEEDYEEVGAESADVEGEEDAEEY